MNEVAPIGLRIIGPDSMPPLPALITGLNLLNAEPILLADTLGFLLTGVTINTFSLHRQGRVQINRRGSSHLAPG